MTERGPSLVVVLTWIALGAGTAHGQEVIEWSRHGDWRCRAGAPEDCYRVAFDPGDRVRLQVGGAYDPGGGLGAWLSGSLNLRGEAPAANNEGDFWKLDTRLVYVAAPLAAVGEHPERVELSAVRGTYINYSSEPHLTLPTRPPRRLWFPFNPGIEVEVGRLSSHPQAGRWGEVGVVRASLVLDFWRTARTGSTGYFTLDFAYDLVAREPALEAAALERLESTITPLSGGRLVVHHEWREGLGWLDLRLGASRRLGLLTDWSTRLGGSASLGRTLVAVNDAPISVVLEGAVDGSREASWGCSWRIGVGLEVGFEWGR